MIQFFEKFDSIPFKWDYTERLMEKMMNRMWILFEREVPLRERCKYKELELYDMIVNKVNMNKWYYEDIVFKQMFDLLYVKNKMMMVVRS